MFKTNLKAYQAHIQAAMKAAEQNDLAGMELNLKWAKEKTETAARLVIDARERANRLAQKTNSDLERSTKEQQNANEQLNLEQCKHALEDKQLNRDRHAIGHGRRGRAQEAQEALLKQFKTLGGDISTLGGHYW